MRNRLLKLAGASAAVFALFAGEAAAQTNSGANIGTGTFAGQDLAWSFIEGTYSAPPSGSTLANAWLVNLALFPANAGSCNWVNACPSNGSDDPSARWISINPAAGESAPAVYTYYHIFDAAKGGLLLGQWSSDNGSSIYLNGTLLGTVGDLAFTNWHDFSGTLQKGQNIIAIETTNITCNGCPNPGAVIARFQTSTVTPEPVSMALLGTGLAGVVGLRRRRKSSNSDDE